MSSDELIDVVDERDGVVAQARRSEVRARNLRHRSVYILVFNSAGQLFVHQRTATKDVFPGLWDVAIGGVLRAGEGYDAAAARELAEEIGVRDVAIRRLFPLQFADRATCVVGAVYSCTCDQPLRLQPEEIVVGAWLDLDVLLERTQRERFCPDGLEALRLYLAKLAAVQHKTS